MQRDAERLAQMRCHTSAAGHPYQKFAWGNRKSLWEDPHAAGIDVRKDLVAYYRQAAAGTMLAADAGMLWISSVGGQPGSTHLAHLGACPMLLM